MAEPVISVVLPVHDAERYVESAVRSILTQTYDRFELLCVDDGSTDDSMPILERLAREDPRIRIISRPHTGIVGALNDGLDAARGSFIARMDADDLALPKRFETQLAYLQANEDVACVGSMVCIIDPDGDELGSPYWLLIGAEEILAGLLAGNGGAVCHPSILIPRPALEAAGGYRAEAEWAEDLDLLLRLAEQGRLENLPDVLLLYRWHAGSVNHRKTGIQVRRILEIVRRAHRRRGLAPPDQLAPELSGRARLTAIDHRMSWGLLALGNDRYAAARKHAWSVVRSRPFHRKAWSLLRKARRGLARQKRQGEESGNAPRTA